MIHRDPFRCGLRCTFAAALLASCAVAQAQVVSFSAVRDSSLPLAEYLSGNYTFTQSQLLTNGDVASVAIASGTAKAQTLLGTNRVAVENTVAVDDETLRASSIGGPFAAAISIWAEEFVITGGTGTGSVLVSAAVTGQFGPKPAPSYGGSGAYFLFVAEAAEIDALFAQPLAYMNEADFSGATLSLVQNVLKPGLTDDGESLPQGSAFGRTLTGTIEFTYGEPFYVVSVLGGYANDFGVLDAFNSAEFGITAPAGAALTAASGFTYAAAVPEPSTYALLAAGFAIVGCCVRRRSMPT